MVQTFTAARSRRGPALPQVAAAIGNTLEWYDFAAYGFLAATFGANFFPLGNHFLSLLASYGVFASGFFTRPLGGVLFGHVGDRVSRRMALLTSVLAMAIPSFMIGLLPTYDGIGVMAPVLLVLLRMIQGISVGGELTVSISYLSERSAVLGALGLAVRMAGLDDSQESISDIGHAPVIVAFATEWRAMILGFLISIPAGAAYYVSFIYLVTFAQQYDALPAAQANVLVTGGLVTLLFGVPLAAALSDRVGRKRVMLAGVIGQLLLAWPLFAIATDHRYWQLRGWEILFAGAQSLVSGPMPAMLAEQFPAAVRCTATSISYNAAMTLLGGTGPMIVVYLIAVSGVPTAPSWYVMTTSVAAAIGILLARERARSALI